MPDKGMPADSMVRLWVLDDVEGLLSSTRARLVGYHTMADDLVDIADNPSTDAAAVNRNRLKVDTRKWLLSKALPKIYGDRLTAEVIGKDGGRSRRTTVRWKRRVASRSSSF